MGNCDFTAFPLETRRDEFRGHKAGMGIEIFTELAEHYPEGIHIVEAGPMFECTGCPCLPLSGTATVGCLDKVPKCGRPLDTHKSVTLGCCDSPASAEIWWNS